jgi:hypothetical protein
MPFGPETQATTAELEETLAAREAVLQTQAGALADLEAVAAERQRIIEELSAANRRLQEACEERLTLIEEQNRTILKLQHEQHAAAALAGSVANHEEARSRLDELIAANGTLQATCDERATLIEARDQSIAMWTQECLRRDEEIARLLATALERLSVIESLSAALERLPR